MKKSKLTGDIAVVEVSHHPTIGSRTRAAKALALQRFSKTSTPKTDVSSFSYLQLRSRRLQKLPFPVSNRTKQKKNGGKKSEGCFGNRGIVVEVGLCCGKKEASFGEHHMDFELRDRSTRESTPCSLILKDYEANAAASASGSTTRPRSSPSTRQREPLNDVQRFIPATEEIEELFACAQQQQQRQRRQFIEKYNFDIVNDLPLPGRYEWSKVIT